ncbi:MAG: hypothetical protein HC876_21485 [Chloroflexaceae bacterium]|nr:hypothetical protein [Chloroflexaceae bacterium]
MSYDDIVANLEDAWVAAGLHEHALVENFQPETFERSYRVELFPEHDDVLSEDTTPPWVEVSFLWTAANQVLSEGRDLDDEDPLDISWTYMVLVHTGLRDRSDSDLVQMFQRAVSRALRRFYAGEAEASINVPVEVRRVYHSNEQGRPQLSYVQLVSSNITNLLDQWDFQDSGALRRVIRNEVTLAGAIIQALRDTFNTNTRNSNTYRPVDTA